MNLKELEEKLNAKRAQLSELFGQYKNEDGSFKAMPEEVRAEIRKRNDEMTEIGKAYDAAREIADIEASLKASTPAPAGRVALGATREVSMSQVQKSLGDLLVESPQFKSWQSGGGKGSQSIEIEGATFKTTMSTSAGFSAPNDRTDVVVFSAQRTPVVADLVPQTNTNLSVIKYMEETTFTNSAATVAEGATKPESALAFTERSVLVEKIATTLPVTDEQLMDVPSIRGIIDNRLALQVLQSEEVQLLTGDGSTPNLQGFLTKSGVQTQAKSSDTVPDAIYKGLTLVRHTGRANPSGIVMHPNDWQDIRLLKDSNGNYIWGSPAEAGMERIWGLPVIVTTAETENTALLGDFRAYSHISRRMGLTIDVGYVNDDFAKNKKTVRAEERLALEIYRAAAFCKVTGI
jgi:HK97 family phage major capsid protein